MTASSSTCHSDHSPETSALDGPSPHAARRPWRGLGAVLVAVAALLAGAGCSSTTTTTDENPSTDTSLKIPAEDGPGVTASTLVVMDMALSFYGTNDGYTKYVEALADKINADGGLSGRKVDVIAPPKLPQPANATVDQVRQAQCAAFESAPEFFTLVGSGYDCLGEQGVVGINNATMTAQDVATPFLTAPANMTDARAAATLALRLREDGQLDEVTKVGVVTLAGDTFGDPEATDALVAGLEEDDPAYEVKTFEAPGTTDADVLSLVVKLKQDGVDFVVPANLFASAAINVGVFAQQQFYPGISGYGIFIKPQAIPTLPEEFLGKIRQYGWKPSTYTVPTGQGEQLTAEQPGADYCLDVAREANISTASGVLGDMMGICDSLRFLDESLDASGSDQVNAEAVLTGARELGTFDCIGAFACQMAPGRPDGAAAVRVIAWDPVEKAFTYQGDDLPTAE